MRVDRRLLAVIAAVALLAGIGGLVLALRRGSEPATPLTPVPTAEESQPLPAPASTPSQATPEQAVAAARARRAAALAELEAAEAEGAQVENEVERLERFTADLKARGEDPTKHADEGLALFRPAFESYRKASARIQQAEAELDAANAELAAAEKRRAGE